MALILLEGLGAPSQKTSLLGGVVQILIYPRPSPRLAVVGLFVRPKCQHFTLWNWLWVKVMGQVWVDGLFVCPESERKLSFFCSDMWFSWAFSFHLCYLFAKSEQKCFLSWYAYTRAFPFHLFFLFAVKVGWAGHPPLLFAWTTWYQISKLFVPKTSKIWLVLCLPTTKQLQMLKIPVSQNFGWSSVERTDFSQHPSWWELNVHEWLRRLMHIC